jgi:hypothetical protein
MTSPAPLTRLRLAPYAEQVEKWPRAGRHIMAQWDDEGVIVYQAYRPAIGRYATAHGRFGGEWSLSRMSWIKPNFLWMMYRCGWATKENQETVLAIRLRRDAFETMLAQAVPSSFTPELYATYDKWKEAVTGSDVRLQWDPDHDPSGVKQERRAIQLGLRGDVLRRYASEWLLGVEDITAFVREQHAHALSKDYAALLTLFESPYPVPPAVAARLGMEKED